MFIVPGDMDHVIIHNVMEPIESALGKDLDLPSCCFLRLVKLEYCSAVQAGMYYRDRMQDVFLGGGIQYL